MNSAWARLPCCFSKDLLKGDFLEFIWPRFRSLKFRKCKIYAGHLFIQNLVDWKNAPRNWEKVFCFWDNCIWIGIVKLSLLRRAYMLSAATVWTRSLKTWHVNKRNFSQLNCLEIDHKYNPEDVEQISILFRPVYHVASEGSSETRLFRDLCNHVFGVSNFGNTKSMRVNAFFKMFKIWSRFQKCRKKFR